MRPERDPIVGGAIHSVASFTISFSTAVGMRRPNCSADLSTLSNSFSERCPVSADISTTSAQRREGRWSRIFSIALRYVRSSFSGTASHLFSAITQERPSSAIRWARMRSWSTSPVIASSMSTTTSARRIALKALPTMKNSGPYMTLPRLRMPAVSIKRYELLPRVSKASTVSLVVPAWSDTMDRSSFTSLLNKLDLPTFGLPTSATLVAFSLSTLVTLSMCRVVISSSRSPSPVPWMPLTG
mmetsp:Transcript_11608/g.25849  ORF Transcript_11608/g.25849 Transcript_11608/m.25849 type:complete len:242 (+) Transcript_11608:439-1164(+)